MQELARRRNVEEQARWDFMALDYNGSCRISPQQALLLFQTTHGPQFTLQTWQKFLSLRAVPEENICFDEIRLWLCDVNYEGGDTKYSDIVEERERLNAEKENRLEEDLNKYLKGQVRKYIV